MEGNDAVAEEVESIAAIDHDGGHPISHSTKRGFKRRVGEEHFAPGVEISGPRREGSKPRFALPSSDGRSGKPQSGPCPSLPPRFESKPPAFGVGKSPSAVNARGACRSSIPFVGTAGEGSAPSFQSRACGVAQAAPAVRRFGEPSAEGECPGPDSPSFAVGVGHIAATPASGAPCVPASAEGVKLVPRFSCGEARGVGHIAALTPSISVPPIRAFAGVTSPPWLPSVARGVGHTGSAWGLGCSPSSSAASKRVVPEFPSIM